jgi:hypothetical protein
MFKTRAILGFKAVLSHVWAIAKLVMSSIFKFAKVVENILICVSALKFIAVPA